MDHIDALERAWKLGSDLLAGLRPADLSLATPCEGWDVRDLLVHTLGETDMMSQVNRGAKSSGEYPDFVGDGASLDGAWQRIGADNVASWHEGGLDGNRAYFYGTFPARVCLLVNIGEVVVHSWDLARPTGQRYDIDPDLAQLVYGLYSAFPLDGMRANGSLGPEILVPADAPVADRLLGLLGRQP
ncbi:MAG: hypothetical protein QOI15_719 [Pseudonocardiales bacterium]|nr:hypothetical protein [Pseudonocardiales bacterium]